MITIKSTEILSPNHSLQLDTLINVVTSNLTMIACHTFLWYLSKKIHSIYIHRQGFTDSKIQDYAILVLKK